MDIEKINKLKQIIKESSKTVFFGGAGVSTASGIPDFRSANGIFSKKLNKNITPEQAVSHSFYQNNPEEFFDFYKKYLIYPNALPNNCHNALAYLEEQNKLDCVITQNIDGLHQKAGSKKVYELHGSVLRNYCTHCNKFFDVNYIINAKNIPLCDECNNIIKPDVVLYEEGLDNNIIDASINAISNADTLIIGGTSLIVYPAAGLIRYFKGKNLVLINKTPTQADSIASLIINEDISKVFEYIMNEL